MSERPSDNIDSSSSNGVRVTALLVTCAALTQAFKVFIDDAVFGTNLITPDQMRLLQNLAAMRQVPLNFQLVSTLAPIITTLSAYGLYALKPANDKPL
jgi:uncharacterized protein YjaG (DUF416 family)